jgi:HPt (histidine-containing phosphotransfer) domain-containing protein
MREELERCLAVGMNDYITKPFLEEVLRRKLERWLEDAGDGLPEPACSAAVPDGPAALPEPLPPLDGDRLTELRSLGRAVGRDVLGEIAETLRSQAHVTEIRSALARGDWPLLKRKAHALRGSSAVLGAMGLSMLCGELERLAPNTEVEACVGPLAALEEEYRRVLSALTAAARHAR